MVDTRKEILIFYGRRQNIHGGLRSTSTWRVRAVVIRSGGRQTRAVFFPTKLRSTISRRRRGFYLPPWQIKISTNCLRATTRQRAGRATDHLAPKMVLPCLHMQYAPCFIATLCLIFLKFQFYPFVTSNVAYLSSYEVMSHIFSKQSRSQLGSFILLKPNIGKQINWIFKVNLLCNLKFLISFQFVLFWIT